jgi:hypothetical protein
MSITLRLFCFKVEIYIVVWLPRKARKGKSGEAASCCVERASELLAECAEKEKGEKMAKSQKRGKNDKVPEKRKK